MCAAQNCQGNWFVIRPSADVRMWIYAEWDEKGCTHPSLLYSSIHSSLANRIAGNIFQQVPITTAGGKVANDSFLWVYIFSQDQIQSSHNTHLLCSCWNTSRSGTYLRRLLLLVDEIRMDTEWVGGWVSVAFEWDSLQTHPNALLSVLARHEMPLRELTTSTCERANGHAGEEGAVVPYVWVSGFVDF